MNSLLLWFGGLLVAALCALAGGPYFIDWNSYRGIIEEEATRLLDRQVRVNGKVNLRFLPTPYVRFEDIRIADATGEFGPPFFRAESFTLWLAIAPLLKGVFEANEVEIRRPVLNLRLGSDGGGNWQTLKVVPSELPFVPRDVALQSVKMSDGILTIYRPGGEEMARLELVESELSGAALDGPYKFRSDIRWNGERREVRASTAVPDADGSIRFKLSVRSPESGNSYTFNGGIADLAQRPRLEGTLSALLHGGDGTAAAEQAVASHVARRGSPESRAFELRANMSGDTFEARFDEIALFFEQDGKPQFVAGSAHANWREKLIFQASLSSRWLDLDRIADQEGDPSPLETLRRLMTRLTGSFPANGQMLTSLNIDQVNLGGDVISGFDMALQQTNGDVQLRRLKAALPGGTHVDLKGKLSRGQEIESFDGELLLRGASLGRFLAWTAKRHSLPETKGDAGFSLQARLSLSPDAIGLKETTAEIAGHTLSGELGYHWKGRKHLALTLDAKRFDMPAAIPEWLGRTLDGYLLRSQEATSAGTAPGSPARIGEIIGGDLRLRLRAGQIDHGELALRDVEAAIHVQDGVLSVPQIRFATGNGLMFELKGELKDIAGRPKGTLRGLVEAADKAALSDASEVLKSHVAPLAPLRVGYTLNFGARSETATELTLDGTVANNRLAATIMLEGGLAAWREAPVDATLTVEGRNLAPVVRTLLPPDELSQTASSEQSPGTILLKMVGKPAAELDSLVRLEMDGVGLDFRGRVAWPKDTPLRLDGELQIARADAGRALAVLGVKRRPLIGTVGVEGKVGVRLQDGILEFAPRGLGIGGIPVNGRVAITSRKEDTRIDGRLAAKEVSLPRLLGLLLVARAADVPIARSGREEGSPWPDEPFDLSNYEGISGRVVLEASRVGLGQGVSLRNGVVEAEVSPAGVNVTKFTGLAFGGTVSGMLKVEKAPAGASAIGAIRVVDAQLAELAPAAGGQPSASGRAQASLQFSGRGLSPLALVAGLSGRGEIELRGVRLPRLSPAAIETVAAAALGGKIEARGGALERALRAALGTGSLTIGTRKLPLEIVDGAVRVAAFDVDASEGRASNQTTIDLASLKFDSEWKLQSTAKPDINSGRVGLPGVSVVYVGLLAALPTLEPHIFSEALERELSVRKLERDVDQLERLRRADEVRARVEAERRRGSANPAPPVIEAPFPLPAAPSTGPLAPQQPAPRPQPKAQRKLMRAPDGSNSPARVLRPALRRRKSEAPVAFDRFERS
jgi:uncharacterized protein involved in outer membrane biogenesis